MIGRLVLFGATGDLAGRYVLPALAWLRAERALPRDFEVLAASDEAVQEDAFRRHVASQLAEHAPDVQLSARQWLETRIRYADADAADADAVRPLLAGDSAVAAYLALPPTLFGAAVEAIAAAPLPGGSRLVLEKPFGEDLSTARALNRRLEELFGRSQSGVYRVDHALGMAGTQSLVGLRLANPVLEAVWSGQHIAQVEIRWEETLALEGRAGYFDRAGALKDVMQNHMMHLLALVAMERPANADPGAITRAKLEALRSIMPITPERVQACTQRARYAAGRIGERDVPAYVDEEGVEPQRDTETFAEVVLTLDAPRWRGTRFALRAGKALAATRTGVVLHFNQSDAPPAERLPHNLLEVDVDGRDNIALQLNAGPSGNHALTLAAPPPDTRMPPYAHVLLDVLGGGSALAVSADEAELAWHVFMPVLEAWAQGSVPLTEYPAGSAGPRSLA